MGATNKSKIAFKVKSAKNYAKALLALFSALQSGSLHVKDGTTGKAYATTTLDDAGEKTINGVFSAANTEFTSVVSSIVTLVNSQTTDAEDTNRNALNTTDGATDSDHTDIVDDIFNVLIAIFPGSQQFGNASAVADNSTSAGIITNFSEENSRELLQLLKDFVMHVSTALPTSINLLRSNDQTSGTLVTTLHTTTFEGVVTAMINFVTNLSGIIEDFESLIRKQGEGQLMTSTTTSTIQTSIASLKDDYDTLLAAAITAVTTEIDA